jgi:hypothetical protein
MRRYYYGLSMLLAVLMAASFVSAVSAQVAEETAVKVEAEETAIKVEKVPSADTAKQASDIDIAVYGEIQAVDVPSGSVDIQYYDYDSDSEKTLKVFVGKDTKIENADSISSIKKGDWADVTYIVKDGRSEAQIITVEKEEVEVEVESAEVVETAPAEE